MIFLRAVKTALFSLVGFSACRLSLGSGGGGSAVAWQALNSALLRRTIVRLWAFMAPAENPFDRSIKIKRIPPFRGGIFLSKASLV
jgi:hypothetical protein